MISEISPASSYAKRDLALYPGLSCSRNIGTYGVAEERFESTRQFDSTNEIDLRAVVWKIFRSPKASPLRGGSGWPLALFHARRLSLRIPRGVSSKKEENESTPFHGVMEPRSSNKHRRDKKRKLKKEAFRRAIQFSFFFFFYLSFARLYSTQRI